MTAHHILVGSYTDQITTLVFTEGADGAAPKLEHKSAVSIGHHPSWLTIHPTASSKQKSVVFTGVEQSEGMIVALEFDAEGKGKVVGQTTAGGRDPCTLEASKDGKELIVGNYSSGHTVTIPLTTTAPYLPTNAESYPTVVTTGTGPREDRQEASHPHHVYFSTPEQDEVLVPDLGADTTWRLARDSSGKWAKVGAVTYPKRKDPTHMRGPIRYLGQGPRHVLVYNGILYTVLELSSELSAHLLPKLPEEAQYIGEASTLSSGPVDPNMLAAEILLAPATDSEPARIYVSNRNDPHENGDTIAVFALASPGTPPKLVGEVRTGLKHVRGMAFDPSGRYLITGGLNGPGAKVYERAPEGEWLREIAHVEVDSPTAFLWL